MPWSIKLAPFDPNEVTYWGPSYDNATTTVEYTGEPVWVRPRFTYAKDTDGEFPEWFTRWGSGDRPTTDRLSSACSRPAESPSPWRAGAASRARMLRHYMKPSRNC